MKAKILPGRALRLGGVLYRAGDVVDYPFTDIARKVDGGVLEILKIPKPKSAPKPKASDDVAAKPKVKKRKPKAKATSP